LQCPTFGPQAVGKRRQLVSVENRGKIPLNSIPETGYLAFSAIPAHGGSSTSNSSIMVVVAVKVKGKAIPLQAWRGPEGSRRLRLPDLKTIGI